VKGGFISLREPLLLRVFVVKKKQERKGFFCSY
jgi:hypothetical protein